MARASKRTPRTGTKSFLRQSPGLTSGNSVRGVIGHFGASVFFSKHIAVGGEIAWKPQPADYAGIQYRPTFYTFDAIYRPTKGSSKRFAPDLSAGLGGARLTFFPNDPVSCAQVPGCPASAHFQQHLGAAARWYLLDYLYLRPAMDVYHVDNYREFGSAWAPHYSVGVGFSVGRRE
jgi:hypothetical protein